MTQTHASSIRLRNWADGDFPLLEKLLGDPEMTKYIGGAETHDHLIERQQRFVNLTDPLIAQMYVIIFDNQDVGSVGYWETVHHGESAYEMGWFVLPAFHRRGIAPRATLAVLANLRSVAQHRCVHAFPPVANTPSNAVCAKVGFSLIEEIEFEYPKGNFLRCNDWRLDLLEADVT